MGCSVATFWEIAARSVSNLFSCILSICNIYLFPALVLRAGFAFLIAPVPVHCFSITFKYLGVTFSKTPSFCAARKHVLGQARKALQLLYKKFKKKTIYPLIFNLKFSIIWFFLYFYTGLKFGELKI